MTNAFPNELNSKILSLVFESLACAPPLRDRLVYNGARILMCRLQGFNRRSEDIDANLTSLSAIGSTLNAVEIQALGDLITAAIRAGFERQSPVIYELRTSTISRRAQK